MTKTLPFPELESLIELCVLQIARGVDFPTFRQRVFLQAEVLFPATGGSAIRPKFDSTLAILFARDIWKHCPHPAHRYAPAPLPEPERNEPCHCSSGRKYKQCCLPLEAGLPFGQLNLLLQLIELLPRARWKELADSKVSVDMVVDLAANWHQEERHADVLALLEPWFKAERHWSARYEPLLDLLLDAYTTLHHPRKKTTLLERALARGDAAIRSSALQRLASMAADDGDYRNAWKLFKDAQRAEPDSPHLAHLEVVLLLSEQREAEARDRARFWLARLARQRDPQLEGLLDFLRSIAAKGAGAMVDLALDRDPALATFLQCWRAAPAPASLYALEPFEGSAGPLTPKPKLERVLADWRESFGSLDYSPLRQHIGDWWDRADAWLALLQRHPELWNAFEVLDGLVHALADLPVPEVAERLGQPLLERGEALLLEVLRANGAGDLRLEWGWMQNRPALNLLGSLVATDLQGEPSEATVERMEWLVGTLNPNDNQGFRQELMRCYLLKHRLDEALLLCDRYPDDFAAMAYNRALALFATGRRDEALRALREASEDSPKLLKFLLAANPKPVKGDGWGIAMGGNEEAWLYRQGHLELWQRYEALDWAKQAAKGARRTRE